MQAKVGDTVLFVSRGSADGKYPPMSVPLIVVRVHNLGTDDGPIIEGWTMNPNGQRYEEHVLANVDGKPGTWHDRERGAALQKGAL